MQTAVSRRSGQPMPPKPMAVGPSLAKRIEELVEFAQAHHVAGPDLLWNVSACVMANMHGEIRQGLLTRIMIPLDGRKPR